MYNWIRGCDLVDLQPKICDIKYWSGATWPLFWGGLQGYQCDDTASRSLNGTRFDQIKFDA